MAIVKKGTKVQWKNGANTAKGTVVEVFHEKVQRTIKGTKVTRNASPEKPAAMVKSDKGGRALHSTSELKPAAKDR